MGNCKQSSNVSLVMKSSKNNYKYIDLPIRLNHYLTTPPGLTLHKLLLLEIIPGLSPSPDCGRQLKKESETGKCHPQSRALEDLHPGLGVKNHQAWDCRKFL